MLRMVRSCLVRVRQDRFVCWIEGKIQVGAWLGRREYGFNPNPGEKLNLLQ
jgi:hypothetical protein